MLDSEIPTDTIPPMQHTPLITEEKLHRDADFAEAQGLLPEFLFRLISASIQHPKDLRLPMGGSTGQSGWDCLLVSPIAFDPYIPQGKSFWEIGSGGDPPGKATEDFEKRTKQMAADDLASSTFIFATPRSASRSWSGPAQAAWINKRKSETNWRDIRIIDGTKLVQWLYLFPAIDFWLAERLGIPTLGLSTPALNWKRLRAYGDPPLSPEVFLNGREEALSRLLQLFEGLTTELRLETRYPEEGVDFVAAALASLEPSAQAAFSGRCLIIDNANTWNSMCSLQTPHVFVATTSLDLEQSGIELRAQARADRHSTIFAATPSAGWHGNAVRLGERKPQDIETVLVSCGYNQERARLLSDRSGGQIPTLKRLILGLSASPDWAAQTETGELRLAALIGRWDGSNKGDRETIEVYLGKAYGEWIESIRPMTLRPDPPLTQRNEKWKFSSRFEGWSFLGPHLSDQDLDRFEQMALQVLSEKLPKFDLAAENRWVANIYGEVQKYSDLLREGVAETLALLGTYPKTLLACSGAKPNSVAATTVRELLTGADWVLWASLQDVLPLLAEASPDEFLEALERDLNMPTPSVVELYKQETSGLSGTNYLTGLLWALETLAWNPDYLTRVTLILARLAESDPGGNWTNRPDNSLSTIFLPWLPQTCASLEKRLRALQLILLRHPDVTWRLLLQLLPSSHQMSVGSRKPAWREWIPQDWQKGVLASEYQQQVEEYASLLVEVAATSLSKLTELLERLGDLPPVARDQVLQYLSSSAVQSLSESDRLPLWQALTKLVSMHRKFFDAEWAMPQDVVAKISEAGEALTPNSPELLYQRLFSAPDFELFDQEGAEYQHLVEMLEARRDAAVLEILDKGNLEALLRFAQAVQMPWYVGFSLGAHISPNIDTQILPWFLESNDRSVSQFVRGFVLRRFRSDGLSWATEALKDSWNTSQKAAFLTLLPFSKATWELSAKQLGDEYSYYWDRTSADAREAEPSHLPEAINQLLQSNRPDAALRCIDLAIHRGVPIVPEAAARVLMQLLENRHNFNAVDLHDCINVIRWLQENLGHESIVLQNIEWGYLRLLSRHRGMTPRSLERRLAASPEFFSEVIKAVFGSEGADPSSESQGDEKQIAENAYRLLREWRTIPGSRDDGTVDGAALEHWLGAAREACKRLGRLDVALSRIGQAFSHAPADPDGTWIHHAVAAILDAPASEKIRDGFFTGIIDSRGAYWGTKGEEERALAAKHKENANAIDHLYPRLSTTVRKIAKWYEALAEHDASLDP
jgi:hypothetical protein